MSLVFAFAGLAGTVTAQTLPEEVQVGGAEIFDFEFDWGRDGVHCPSCNFGAGNARVIHVDPNHDLWVAGLDVLTGNFVPADGRGLRVGRNAVMHKEIGNGPEWVFSLRGSEIVYSRWSDGQPRVTSNIQLGFASMSDGTWTSGAVKGGKSRMLPFGTLDLDDPAPTMHYQVFDTGTAYWRDISAGSVEQLIPAAPETRTTRRWVPGTRDVLITAPAAPSALKPSYDQVFLFHTETGVMEQLTFDAVDKVWAFMWRAPEFAGEYVFFTVVGGNQLKIYRKLPHRDGSLRWKVVNSVAMPAATPYIVSPEPFVHNGKSWIFFSLSASSDLSDYSVPSLIAMTGIEPGASTLRLLTTATEPPRQRRDPEYFITANGPYLYYDRYLQSTGGTIPLTHEGVFRVDTGLGPRVP